MFDLFCNFILGGFMCKKPLQNYIFLFMNLLGTYNLYPFFKLLIYPASTSWIVTKGILKDVEIQEMTIPAIIVDCAYLNQCFTCRSTARFHYKYFTRVCKAHTTTDFAVSERRVSVSNVLSSFFCQENRSCVFTKQRILARCISAKGSC